MKINIVLLLALATANSAVLPTSPEIVKVLEIKTVVAGTIETTSASSKDTPAPSQTKPAAAIPTAKFTSAPAPASTKSTDIPIPAQSAPISITVAKPIAPVQSKLEIESVGAAKTTVKNTASPVAASASAVKPADEKSPSKKATAETVSTKIAPETVTPTENKPSPIKSTKGSAGLSFLHDASIILPEYEEFYGFLGDFDEDDFDGSKDESVESVGSAKTTTKTTASPIAAPASDVKPADEKNPSKKVTAETISTKIAPKTAVPTENKTTTTKSTKGSTGLSFLHDASIILPEYDGFDGFPGDFDDDDFDGTKDELVVHNYFE